MLLSESVRWNPISAKRKPEDLNGTSRRGQAQSTAAPGPPKRGLPRHKNSPPSANLPASALPNPPPQDLSVWFSHRQTPQTWKGAQLTAGGRGRGGGETHGRGLSPALPGALARVGRPVGWSIQPGMSCCCSVCAPQPQVASVPPECWDSLPPSRKTKLKYKIRN